MAEFMEVMRQSRRMCKAHVGCEGCSVRWIVNPGQRVCVDLAFDNPALFEDRVMKWAAEHPEKKTPSWYEAWKLAFPETPMRTPCPKFFLSREKGNELCSKFEECTSCMKSPICDEVAERLGVKPIKNEGGAKANED